MDPKLTAPCARRHRFFVCWSLFAAVGLGQVADFQLRGVTATQAVFSYTAPNDDACEVEVSEDASYRPLVHDFNPALFRQAHSDRARPSSVLTGKERVVVAGKRTADEALDGNRYSRALQTNTKHYVRITCSGTVHETTFETANLPIGMTRIDPLPVDPARPGNYAWPTLDWNDRDQRIIDPHTGVLIKRISMPTDSTFEVRGTFSGALDWEGSWNNVEGLLKDDSNLASTDGTNRGWLFLSAPISYLYHFGNHDASTGSVNSFRVVLNAWCSSDDCPTAVEGARDLEACLTVDGISCASAVKTVSLKPCSTNCRGTSYEVTLGAGPEQVLKSWSPLPGFDQVDFHTRRGIVNRKGKTVTYVLRNLFNTRWTEGTPITIAGNFYRIEKVLNERTLVLAGDQGGEESEVDYEASPTGILLRKKSPGGATLAVQFARFEATHGGAPPWDSAGEGDAFVQCAHQTTAGPDGEQGWHCNLGGTLYWIGQTSGKVTGIGNARMTARSGVDGWQGHGLCGTGVTWDRKDPNTLYCLQPDNAGGRSIVRGTYSGDNSHLGQIGDFDPLKECTATTTTNCWVLENITPASRNLTLNQQMAALHPDWKDFRPAAINLVGTTGTGNSVQLMARRGTATNDFVGYLMLFDFDQRRITAAAPSWKYAPARWGALHGAINMGDPNWLVLPLTFFHGSFAGTDVSEYNGPFVSKVVSGPIRAGGEACPVWPADSKIPQNEWPQGSRCLSVTVDGEPGDPTPFTYSAGTLSSSGAEIQLSGGTWDQTYSQAQMRVANQWYTFTYLDSNRGRLSPTPPTLTDASYVLYLDEVNNSKTGNALHGYLQDAEPGDLFCAVDDPQRYYGTAPSGCGYTWHETEYLRLLKKDGKVWTFQRGWTGAFDSAPGPYLPVAPGASLVVIPSSCYFVNNYACSGSSVFWNTSEDRLGMNAAARMRLDKKDLGTNAHSARSFGLRVAAVSSICPEVEGSAYHCYNVRVANSTEELFDAENRVISLNPRFAGVMGLGDPNDVDSHPTHQQYSATEEDRKWFLDGRPLIGDSVNGKARPTNTEGDLWKFEAGALKRLRRKLLPTYAFCGANVLADVSGPNSLVTGETKDAYKYCVAEAAGECQTDSKPGQVFLNCPQISTPYCIFPGVGRTDADLRDICIGDLGGYSSGLTQIDLTKPGLEGRNGRMLTQGLSRYRYIDIFWNAKVTPDGKWMLFRTTWADGQRTDAFLAKLPPFPAEDGYFRGDFIPIRIEIPGSDDAAATGAVVEFGYDPELRCTSRNDACVKGAEPGNGYTFAGLSPRPVPCRGGCSVEIPVIPQRVFYYRIRHLSADGETISRSGLNAWTSP